MQMIKKDPAAERHLRPPHPAVPLPSDDSWFAPARLDAGNLDGFAVGLTNYKGVSGSNWGDDKGARDRSTTSPTATRA